ncbi:hypothetical protein [Algoriphagus halophilus]|uniref:DltD C-terminal region n=1 Tax=Algoriphagus halophilus TaxID=226505 RepID=A0A1N6ED21_9BACT|nr:hypothetical protein [Algoriphagus halophilus]SIN80910.1 hypothetical protein SAMN05444394_1995 [Algoriphagus halophilus]
MRKFGQKFFFISAVFALLLYSVDYFIQEGLKTSNYREVSKWNEVIKGGIDAELLIVGSSRALVHYDCELIEEITGKKCFNLGFDGTLFEHQRLMLDLYLKNNKAPETLVWNVDYHSFEHSKEFYGFEQLVPYQDQLEVQMLLEANEETDALLYQIPVLRYSFNPKMKMVGLLNFFELYETRPALIKGYRKSDKVWDREFDRFKAKYKEGISYKVEEQIFAQFSDRLITLIHDKIEVVLVISPIYYEAKNLIRNEDQITKRVENLSHEYGFTFLDYSDDSINYSKDNFYNGTHLNKNGVSHFTKKFALESSKF